MKCLAIIPARGGSKRIPRKNIREFLGKPIIAYSIKAALESGLFEEVMVSTDDEEVADVARSYGAQIPFFRSQKNSDDFSTTANVISEVLSEYRRRDRHFVFACCIYATAPLLRKEAVHEAFELMLQKSFDTVFPVVAFGYPIWRSLTIDEGKVEMIWPKYKNKRSQDLPVAWHDAGQFYWINVSKFNEAPDLFTSNSGVVKLEEWRVQDIDNLDDWKLAELKAQLLYGP